MKADIPARLAARQKLFLSFLQPRLGNRAAAEDVLQAAYLKAAEKAATIRDDESSVAWFYRLLRNAVADAGRAAAREQRVLAEGKFADPEDVGPDFKEAVCHCVSGLAETLRPAHARLLRRVDLDGASVAEVAGEEGITPNTAAVRLHRARAALRDKLKFVCGACARHGCLDCGCPQGSAL